MSIAERVNADLPFLRRFARSVTGSQEAGDAAVVSTLETIVADPTVLDQGLCRASPSTGRSSRP